MSRIILSRYTDGTTHVVVGWDHPAQGAFWQEWATADEVKAAEAWLEDNGDSGKYGTDEYYLNERIAETEVKREGGMWPGIPLEQLRDDMPEELRSLITDKVYGLLVEHANDPDSGYKKSTIDLTQH
jgi:hypothetical protein